MSVETEADRLRDETIAHLNDAIHNIMLILEGKVWGAAEYKVEYIDRLSRIFTTLISMRNDL